MTGGEAEANPLPPLPDVATDFEQPQGVELQAFDLARDQPAAEGVEQPVGCRMQQQAELVGPEAVAAQAVGKAGPFQILDRVLAVAAGDVPGIECVRGIDARGDDEAGVRPLGSASALMTTRRRWSQLSA